MTKKNVNKLTKLKKTTFIGTPIYKIKGKTGEWVERMVTGESIEKLKKQYPDAVKVDGRTFIKRKVI